MALRGKKPEAIQKRLKALFYGPAGVGKTTAAIQFPYPYLIDTEKGSENNQYVDLLGKSGGVVFHTTDFQELISEIRALLTEKHEYKTLIIDPLTVLYNNLLDQAETKVGSDFGRHYGEANKHIRHLINLLMRLDMNVIITAHAKNEYSSDMKVLGQTFDCYKKLDYLFDLVFEIQKRGKERVGIVKKSRIESFLDSEQFPFSYNTIAIKYGRDILERDAIAQELASLEQITEIKRLADLIKTPQEIIQKWLDKAQAETWEEMPADVIQKCIDHLNEQIKPKEKS
jgi:DNA polymerase III delta prime subunit